MLLYSLLQLANITVGSWHREGYVCVCKILHLPFLGIGTSSPAELLTQIVIIIVSLVEESINRDKRGKMYFKKQERQLQLFFVEFLKELPCHFFLV